MNRAKLFQIAVCLGIVFCCSQAVFAEAIMPDAPGYSWLFDEGTGTTTAANTGGHDGTLMYGATWSTSTPFTYTGNHSIDLTQGTDATNSAHVLTAGHTFGTAGAIFMWLNTNTAFSDMSDPKHYPFMVDTSATNRTYQYYNGSDTWSYTAVNGISYKNTWGNDTTFPANVWHNVVVTWDNAETTKLRVYSDGVLRLSSTTSAGAQTIPDYLFFGCHQNMSLVSTWKGQIDEYAFWDSALSVENVEWLAGHSLTEIPEPSTLALLGCGLIGLLAYAWRKRK